MAAFTAGDDVAVASGLRRVRVLRAQAAIGRGSISDLEAAAVVAEAEALLGGRRGSDGRRGSGAARSRPGHSITLIAGLAQLVEHLTCNHVVASSTLAPGSNKIPAYGASKTVRS